MYSLPPPSPLSYTSAERWTKGARKPSGLFIISGEWARGCRGEGIWGHTVHVLFEFSVLCVYISFCN